MRPTKRVEIALKQVAVSCEFVPLRGYFLLTKLLTSLADETFNESLLSH